MQSKKSTTFYKTYRADKRPVVILLHGFRGTHNDLYAVARGLSNCQVIIPDLPGHGKSAPLKSEHSINNLITWLHRFVINLQLEEPPIMIGYSLGAVLAAYYAMDFPNTISKLILISPLAASTANGGRSHVSRAINAHYRNARHLPAGLARSWLSSPSLARKMYRHMATKTDKKTSIATKDRIKQSLKSFAEPRVVFETYKSFTERHVGEVADRINMPTLFIMGDLDNVSPPATQRSAISQVMYAKFSVIRGAGHLLPFEHPSDLAGIINNYIRHG